MGATIVKTSDFTIYIHDDDCDADMNTAVQEVAGIIFDIYKRKNGESPNYNQVHKDGSP